MPGTSVSEQGKGLVTQVPGYNAGTVDTLPGMPVAHYPFETIPHDYKFWCAWLATVCAFSASRISL